MYAVVLTTEHGGCESVNIYVSDEDAIESARGLCAEYDIDYDEAAKKNIKLWNVGYRSLGAAVFIMETEITY